MSVPGADVKKYHKLGGVNNRNVSSSSFGGLKSEVRVSAALAPPNKMKESVFHALPWLLGLA